MNRLSVLLICILLLSASMFADDSSPIIEMRADRTMVYPQRMALTGEESLMDVLQMVPELMIAGYEDVIAGYNLRIDNCPMNGDARLILSQMKAKDIATIQVCHNTGVAKGTIGRGKVLDINMARADTLKGFVEGQGGFGKDAEGIGTVNALYGSRRTDLYANASYRYQGRIANPNQQEYLTLHMTNRFDDHNRLLTYFTQQYLEQPSATTRKVLGRARYFHTFNDLGTELLIVGSYQYASDPLLSTRLPLVNLELNTPLLTKRLTMMLGAEGDFVMTKKKGEDRSWDVFNNDIYLQFTYSLPQWKLTAGNRVMFYNYKVKNEGDSQKHTDTRNNTNASIIYLPDRRNQLQVGYYRKYYNPAYDDLFMNTGTLSDEQWAIIKDGLDERDVNQLKLAYAYSRRQLTVQAEASHFIVEDGENFTELGSSAYWKAKGLTLTGGAHLFTAKSGTYASFRFAPTVCLPHDWQIGLQLVYSTKKSPRREPTGVPLYGCLSVEKPLGRHWHVGLDWHDMFDAASTPAPLHPEQSSSARSLPEGRGGINRHAAHVKIQYRF